MRLRLEATPGEVKEKSQALAKELVKALRHDAPDLAEALEKALPERDLDLKHLVLQQISERTQTAYHDHVWRMLAEIERVVLRSTKTTSGVLSKGGPYIGPRGGMWADPEHTQHWEPGMGEAQPRAEAAPEPQQEVAPQEEPPPAPAGEPAPEAEPVPTTGQAQPEPPPQAASEVPVVEAKGPTKERFNDQAAEFHLKMMGEYLFSAQYGQQQVIDNMGFNHYDFQNWHAISGNLPAMRKMLKKYKGQISSVYGEDMYHKCGLSDPEPATGVKPTYHGTFGSLMMSVNGKVKGGKAEFQKYLSIQKEFGLKFDGQQKAWYVPKGDIPEFLEKKLGDYKKQMATLGIEVGDVPEPKAKAAPPPSGDKHVDQSVQGEDASDVISAIKAGHNKNTFVVREKDGIFSFYFPYDPKINLLFNNKAGQLSGITKYDPNDKSRQTHDLELVEEAIDKLKAMHPDWNVVLSGVKEARHAQDIKEAELAVPIPEVQKKLGEGLELRPFQNAGVRFLDEANGNAIIGDEMGLGKTIQTLAWSAKNNKRVVVVCPKVVRRNWLEEAHKFFPGHFKGHELRAADLKKGKIPDLKDLNIVTINYESLEKFRPMLEAAGFDTMIMDESHRMKNPKAKLTKAIQEMSQSPSVKHRILLSGTAVKNKREDLFTQLDLVAPGKFSLEQIKYGSIGGLWMDMRKHYIARSKSKVLKDLPDKSTSVVKFKPKTQLPDFEPGMGIGQISQLKGQVAKAKVPATKDMVDEILESSDSRVLVFTDSVDAAKALKEAYGDTAILHHGEMSDNAREDARKQFQHKDEAGNFDAKQRVFITTQQSCGVGVTLTAADKVVFNDLPWTAAELRQSEDRVHRIGQKNAVNVYWVTAEGNLWDENVSDIVKRKYDMGKKMNQGKQLSPEEIKWMNSAVTLDEIYAQIHGQTAGPSAPSKSTLEPGDEGYEEYQAELAAKAAAKAKKEAKAAAAAAATEPATKPPEAAAPVPVTAAAPEPPAPPVPAPAAKPTMSLEQKVEHAKKLGAAAFASGLSATPAHDAALMPLMSGIQPGTGDAVKILDAWTHAWTAANLAAPVEEPAKPSPSEVTAFLAGHGGKIREHHSDPNKLVIKVPKDKPHIMEQVKQKYGFTGTHIPGTNYNMLEVPKAAFQKSLTKAGPYVGPRGGMWADPEHTQHWEGPGAARAAKPAASAPPKKDLAKEVSETAQQYGGKVVPHATDKTKLVVKMPLNHHSKLYDIKTKYGLSDPVIMGKHYAILPVPATMFKQPVAPKPEPTPPTHMAPADKLSTLPPYVKTEWVEHKSLDDARTWAKARGVDIGAADLHTANHYNQALAEQHAFVQKHVEFLGTSSQLHSWAEAHPEIAKRAKTTAKHKEDLETFKVGGSAIAIAHPTTGKPYTQSVIVIQEGWGTAEKCAEKLKGKSPGFSLGDSLADIVRHELGHVEGFVFRHLYPKGLHGPSAWDLWKKHCVAQLKSSPMKVMKEISEYGATTPHECWAEVSVMRRKGMKLPAWVQAAIDEMEIDKRQWDTMGSVGGSKP